jgi:hypothetical protein
LVGLLAVQGHAESRDFIIAGLGTMLARSYPSKLKDSARQLVIVLIGVAMIVKVLVACSPSVQEKAAAAEATYAADMLKCVNDSPTPEASKTCRAKVRERWHVDGGDR